MIHQPLYLSLLALYTPPEQHTILLPCATMSQGNHPQHTIELKLLCLVQLLPSLFRTECIQASLFHRHIGMSQPFR
jgi:hypothetical protein